MLVSFLCLSASLKLSVAGILNSNLFESVHQVVAMVSMRFLIYQVEHSIHYCFFTIFSIRFLLNEVPVTGSRAIISLFVYHFE